MTAGNRRAGCWRLLWLAVPFALLAGASVTWADSERRELQAGQMLAVGRSVLQPVRPLEASNWPRLVAATEVAQGPATWPGAAGPQGQVRPGSTGPLGDTPASPVYPCTYPCDTSPRPPSNIPSPPSAVPGSPSPRGGTPGTDVTQRDLPSGPLPRGGETRVRGDTFTVQSAPEFTTYQEITAHPVVDFQVATQVRAGGGSGLAGLYVTAAPTAENQPGDLFFGMDGAGVVLQRHDGAGWRDLPRQARRLEPSVRLDVARRAGRYEFRWNGAPIGSAAAAGGPMRVFLFAGPGVRAEFSTFSVSQLKFDELPEQRTLPPAPAPSTSRPATSTCGWVRREGGWFGQGEQYLGAAHDCLCNGVPSTDRAACGPYPASRR